MDFERLLRSRGIVAVPQQQVRAAPRAPPVAAQTLRDIDDIDIDFEDDRVVDFFGLTRVEPNPDADEFYEEGAEPDGVVYVEAAGAVEGEGGAGAVDSAAGAVGEGEGHGDAADDASPHRSHLAWEFPSGPRDASAADGAAGSAPGSTPGSTSAPSDPFTMGVSPGSRFGDAVELRPAGIRKLGGLEHCRRFKNNLTAVLAEQYLVTAALSELLVYAFEIDHLPQRTAVLRIDVRPEVTRASDRLVLTWPHFPHTINYVKVGQFLRRPMVAVCMDDGLIKMWRVDRVVERARAPSAAVLSPDHVIRMSSSCWGLDFADNFLAASDNLQTVTLLYYSGADECFYHVTTHAVLHNIPEVSFASVEEHGDGWRARVNCASISGEVLVFECDLCLVAGALARADQGPRGVYSTVPEDVDSARFARVRWGRPRVTQRLRLGEDCWTCKPVAAAYFKPVASLAAATGDWARWGSARQQRRREQRILRESAILGRAPDPVHLSALGGAAAVQFLECPVVHLAPARAAEDAQLTGVDDVARRTRKTLAAPAPHAFLAVSTSRRLGLLRADTLLCVAATGTVFDATIPFSEDSKFANRISITAVVPELLCVLALTQQGLVTVVRLCQHRGVYTMRQEHLFPNAPALALGHNGYRTLAGMACRNMSVAAAQPRFYVYLTYTDGIVLTYEMAPGSRVPDAFD